MDTPSTEELVEHLCAGRDTIDTVAVSDELVKYIVSEYGKTITVDTLKTITQHKSFNTRFVWKALSTIIRNELRDGKDVSPLFELMKNANIYTSWHFNHIHAFIEYGSEEQVLLCLSRHRQGIYWVLAEILEKAYSVSVGRLRFVIKLMKNEHDILDLINFYTRRSAEINTNIMSALLEGFDGDLRDIDDVNGNLTEWLELMKSSQV